MFRFKDRHSDIRASYNTYIAHDIQLNLRDPNL